MSLLVLPSLLVLWSQYVTSRTTAPQVTPEPTPQD
jgi:hypothetical protein